jgi:hypothetical protein
MKKILLVFLTAFVFLLAPTVAQAHFKEKDGHFNGLLHVDPGDKATAQEHVTLMMTIADTTGQFQIGNCDCEVTISTPGKLPYTQKITTPAAATGGLYSVMVPYVFPRGGTYNISFIGKPTTPDAFTPFNITWDDFKVSSTTNEIQTLKTPKNPIQSNMLPIVFTVLLLAAAGFVIFKKKSH